MINPPGEIAEVKVPAITQVDHQDTGGENPTPSTVVMPGSLTGREEEVRNINIRPTIPRPSKIVLVSENVWSANPKARNLDPNIGIPEDLETNVGMQITSKKAEDRKAELRKRSLSNEVSQGVRLHVRLRTKHNIRTCARAHGAKRPSVWEDLQTTGTLRRRDRTTYRGNLSFIITQSPCLQ